MTSAARGGPAESGLRSGPDRAGVVALVAVALFGFAAFTPNLFNDGDTWSHLATGDWIIAHAAVPRADPFSHSMAGAPWTAHEWLSELLFALAFRAGGWSGVALLTAGAAAGAAAIMGVRVARDLSGLALVVVLALGLCLWAPGLLARPHVLALPIAAAWTASLLAARDRDAPPPLAGAALMIPWVNMHGGFMFGLLLIAPFALEAIVDARPGARAAAARGWGLFACPAAVAALIDPYGAEALLFPFRLMGLERLSQISEWSPADFSRVEPLEIALLSLLGFALYRPVSAPPIRIAMLLGLLAMALAHARHGQLLGLIAPMLLARPIAAAIGGSRRDGASPGARTALPLAIVAALALSAMRLADPLTLQNGPNTPIAALAAVPQAVRETPVLNAYGFGGYLILAHIRPFIDGRADMYGGSMLALYARIASGDPEALKGALDRYRIGWTLFAPGDPAVALLDRDPGWRRTYADEVAVVHVRADRGVAAPAGTSPAPGL